MVCLSVVCPFITFVTPKEGKIWGQTSSQNMQISVLCCRLVHTNENRFHLLPNYFVFIIIINIIVFVVIVTCAVCCQQEHTVRLQAYRRLRLGQSRSNEFMFDSEFMRIVRSFVPPLKTDRDDNEPGSINKPVSN